MTLRRQRGYSWWRMLAGIVILLVLTLVFVWQRYVSQQITSPAVVLNAIFGTGIETPAEATLREHLHLAPGFTLSVYAPDLPNARGLTVTASDDLLVTRPRKGEVLLLGWGKQRAQAPRVLLSGLNLPHGAAIVNDWLYVAETDAIGRVRFDAERGAVIGEFERIVTGLPGGGNHWARNLRLGPDGWLYINIGSSCNVCTEEDRRRATLMRLRPDGTGLEVYATGLRNSMGFDWAPWSGAFYAADIARDLLGDNFPPDELNLIEKGGFYGWPFANGVAIADPDMGHLAVAKVDASRVPVFAYPAHTSPLSLHFLRHERFAETYPRTALSALHGSWNRSTPDGFEVVALRWTEDGSISSSKIISGFWTGETILGRPVSVVEDSKGELYISDDYAGAIYRLSYNKP